MIDPYNILHRCRTQTGNTSGGSADTRPAPGEASTAAGGGDNMPVFHKNIRDSSGSPHGYAPY